MNVEIPVHYVSNENFKNHYRVEKDTAFNLKMSLPPPIFMLLLDVKTKL